MGLVLDEKKHASKEHLSMWVLKFPFIKKNVEHSQTERVKKRYQQKILLRTFKGNSIWEGQNKSFSKLSNQRKGCLIIKLYELKTLIPACNFPSNL